MDGGSSYSGDLGGSRLQNDNKRIKDSQAQVNEVVGIMRVNVEKVLERDQKLSELDNRAEILQQGASQFEQGASRLKRKMWWQNVKMMIIIGIIGGVMLLILIAWIVSIFNGDEGGDKP